MSFLKRAIATLSLFSVFVMGSFSFLPRAIALSSPSFNYEPFYVAMPQLPDGYFDGDILATDSGYSLSLDFSNLSSDYSGSSSSSGSAQSQGNVSEFITFPIYNTRTNDSWTWSDGSVYNDEFDSWDVPGANASNGSGGMPSGTGENPTGQITGSSVSSPSGGGEISGYGDDYIYNESGSESGSSDYSGTVSGTITANGDNSQHYRFRTFSCIESYNNSITYFWFIVDARCQISSCFGSSSSGRYNLTVSRSRDYFSHVFYFSPSGAVINHITFTSLTFATPVWISAGFPPPSDAPFIRQSDLFRDAVFGKDTLLFSYLHQLDSDLNTIHNDLTSLNSSITNSINNQTNTMMNADAASGFDPTSVSNMLEYGSLESNYHAPSTDQIFSVSGGSFTDGMGFWRDRMNELLYFSNSPALSMTIFSLTLGLAVLVIGRRVSGGGSA